MRIEKNKLLNNKCYDNIDKFEFLETIVLKKRPHKEIKNNHKNRYPLFTNVKEVLAKRIRYQEIFDIICDCALDFSVKFEVEKLSLKVKAKYHDETPPEFYPQLPPLPKRSIEKITLTDLRKKGQKRVRLPLSSRKHSEISH